MLLRRIHYLRWRRLGVVLVGALLAAAAEAQTPIERSTPVLDIWNYPFAMSATFGPAPVFGAIGNTTLDNRDAQFYMSFRTDPTAGETGVLAGLGASSYLITTARLTLTLSNSEVVFDGTYDPISSFS